MENMENSREISYCGFPSISSRKSGEWELNGEDIKVMDIPVLTELEINIGHIFIHRNQVWVRTSEYTAISITENGSGAYYFGKLGDYLKNHSGDYLRFNILKQDQISNMILNNSKGK